eukprot:TRINITY_DN32824_c0_g1_i2.p1 TRINITY_DN32824_c0_g1~~TRINITY_DN32824_c0_g1_i2.p1  ORF type:complete len:265 (-),score=54.86 TRINITY_DN32824_c0_g1_i2:83-877(-)
MEDAEHSPRSSSSSPRRLQSLKSSSAMRQEKFRDRLANMGGPSVFSAPEQFVALFTGSSPELPSTDIYRAAAIILTAFRPMTRFGNSVSPLADPAVAEHSDTLRRLCHNAVLKRAHAEAAAAERDDFSDEEEHRLFPKKSIALEALHPSEEDVSCFTSALECLLRSPIRVDEVGFPETREWLQSCLSRDPQERPTTMEAALDMLDIAWSEVEANRLEERKRTFTKDQAASALLREGENPAPEPGDYGYRLAIETPSELKEMKLV